MCAACVYVCSSLIHPTTTHNPPSQLPPNHGDRSRSGQAPTPMQRIVDPRAQHNMLRWGRGRGGRSTLVWRGRWAWLERSVERSVGMVLVLYLSIAGEVRMSPCGGAAPSTRLVSPPDSAKRHPPCDTLWHATTRVYQWCLRIGGVWQQRRRVLCAPVRSVETHARYVNTGVCMCVLVCSSLPTRTQRTPPPQPERPKSIRPGPLAYIPAGYPTGPRGSQSPPWLKRGKGVHLHGRTTARSETRRF